MNILTAMSGGVDSSVSTRLLLEAGHKVSGVTFVTDQSPESVSAAKDASDTAKVLGISHTVLDISEEFKSAVKEYFVRTYEEGKTPNPCVVCNREIKFGFLFDYAEKAGFDAVATGHYARTVKRDGRCMLYRAADERKDQSYMLSLVPEERLMKAEFPLGGYTKDEIRALAEKWNIPTAAKKDSQDICFIPDGDYMKFITGYRGYEIEGGDYLSPDGRVLGRHMGQMCYTIGQRKGLGIALGRHMFVLQKNAHDNTVVLGDEEHLFKKTLNTDKINLIGCDSLSEVSPDGRFKVKIRYAHKGAPATVNYDGAACRIDFDEAQRAPSPGQFAVLYAEDEFGIRAVGGGEIE